MRKSSFTIASCMSAHSILSQHREIVELFRANEAVVRKSSFTIASCMSAHNSLSQHPSVQSWTTTVSIDTRLIKQIVGHDYITGRNVKEKYLSFQSKAKVIFISNGVPKIFDSSGAMEDKIFVFSFNRSLSEKGWWTKLHKAIFKDERQQVLALFIHYASQSYTSARPRMIESDREMRDEVYSDSNPFVEFFNANYKLASDADIVLREEVRLLYVEWCKKLGNTPYSSQKLYKAFVE